MKQNYEVVEAFWHKHQWRAVGEVIAMTDAEAKYLVDPLGHNVKLKVQAELGSAKTAPVVAPAVPAAAAAAAPAELGSAKTAAK
jgi:hypothetical protein